jgi:hypothetical protein
VVQQLLSFIAAARTRPHPSPNWKIKAKTTNAVTILATDHQSNPLDRIAQ